jgi:hypothetical protein
MDWELIKDLPWSPRLLVYTFYDHLPPAEETQIALYQNGSCSHRIRAIRRGPRLGGSRRWEGAAPGGLWDRVWRWLESAEVPAIVEGGDGRNGQTCELYVRIGQTHTEYSWWVAAPEGWGVLARTAGALEHAVADFLSETERLTGELAE